MVKTRKIMLLFFTAILIVGSSVKILLGKSDLLDKSIALLTVIIFFLDQITD